MAEETETIATIGYDEIRRRVSDRTLVLVDVLPAASFSERHLPGARNLPVAEIEARARELLPDRGADIVVYCGGYT